MTKIKARNIFGITSSASPKKIEQIYFHKSKQLQIRMSPGFPCSERLKAEAELVELITARKTLHKQKMANNKKQVNVNKQYQVNKNNATYPQNYSLNSLWEHFFNLIPIPKPLVAFLIIFVFVVVTFLLIKTL